MAFSPQFRASAKISTLCAGLWAALGVVLGSLQASSGGTASRMASLPTYALMFGALGGISGFVTSLLVARAESGRTPDQLALPRLALWGALGGATPALLFALLAAVFGAPLGSYGPLFGLGGLGATVGGLLGGVAALAVKRASRAAARDEPKFPAP